MDTRASLGVNPQTMYDKNLLIRATPLLCLSTFGQRRNLMKRSGDQISYRRFGSIATSTTPLTEGITPAPASLNETEIKVTVAQYGNHVIVSDMLDTVSVDPVIMEATDVLGENGGQSVEEIIRAELLNGTNVVYPVGRTARSQIQSTDVLTAERVQKGVAILGNANAPTARGERGATGMMGKFMGWIHPFAFKDLHSDTRVLTTIQYSDPTKLWEYQLPELYGVVWYRSTKAPVFANAGLSAAVDVYCTFIFGLQAFGVVDVAGQAGMPDASGKLKTIVKTDGGTSDPLEQRNTIAWKSIQAPKILNGAFMTRIEHAVAA